MFTFQRFPIFKVKPFKNGKIFPVRKNFSYTLRLNCKIALRNTVFFFGRKIVVCLFCCNNFSDFFLTVSQDSRHRWA